VLAAADRRLLAVVVSGLPGHVVRDMRLAAGDEREVHRQGGVLLRRPHRRCTEVSMRTPSSAVSMSTCVTLPGTSCVSSETAMTRIGRHRFEREQGFKPVFAHNSQPDDAMQVRRLWSTAVGRYGSIRGVAMLFLLAHHRRP
jgi:hypothetical protein